MAHQNPSIQSFYSPIRSDQASSSFATSSSSPAPGDGFTSSEIAAVLRPRVDAPWVPGQDYEEVDIAALVPGPHCVTFQGRVANLYEVKSGDKRAKGSKACFKLILKDDTGCVTVKLWVANIDYELHLGQLLSIWAVHISNGEQDFTSAIAPLFTSLFPERDRSVHLMIHENSDDGLICKTPLHYREGRPIVGLMTLDNFINDGCDVADAKVLVCVKSIGPRKKITSRRGTDSTLVNIRIFDDTAEATLTLWDAVANSSARWTCSRTVLLLTDPSCDQTRQPTLAIRSETLVDIDPCCEDAIWIRGFAKRLTTREHVNPPFPETFDFEAAIEAQNQILFKFSDVDEFARAMPKERFYGHLSVILLELNLVTMFRRNMLFCNECCGIPIFANSVGASCKQCKSAVSLAINPRNVCLGVVLDESGQVNAGKLQFSVLAWTQLLGRTPSQLCESSIEVIKALEQRILFLRVTLSFGWAATDGDGSGRICVWQVSR